MQTNVQQNLTALVEIWLRRKAHKLTGLTLAREYCTIAVNVCASLGHSPSEWVHNRLTNKQYRRFVTDDSPMSIDKSLWTIVHMSVSNPYPQGLELARLLASINHLYHVMLR